MIVGIVGFAGSGKDTIGDILVNSEGYSKDSFANSLKDVCASAFGWERAMLEGDTLESRNWRNGVDQWWADKLRIPDFTPRFALQHIGTDVFRNHFNDNIWILGVENRLRKQRGDVVITDCRFPNEIALLKQMGGQVWQVERGERPSWYDVAEKANKGYEASAMLMQESYRVHQSEWAWIGTEMDAIINNDGSLLDLSLQINKTLHNC